MMNLQYSDIRLDINFHYRILLFCLSLHSESGSRPGTFYYFNTGSCGPLDLAQGLGTQIGHTSS